MDHPGPDHPLPEGVQRTLWLAVHEALAQLRQDAGVVNEERPPLSPVDEVLLATLTERQRTYIALACDPQEYTTHQIADRMGITHHAVEKHRQAVYKKLGVHSAVGLMHAAWRLGLLPNSTREGGASLAA